MESVIVSLTLVLSILTTAVLVEWVARSRHPSRLFFFSLGRERDAADDRRARRLRIANGVVTLIGLALVLLPLGEAAAVLATVICPFVSIGWMSVEMIGAVRSVRLERVPGRYVVSLEDAPSFRDYVSMPLQLVNVLFVIVPSAVFAWLITQLPEHIPAQFDAAGNVSRYASPHELWSMAGLVLFDVLLLWAIVWGVSRERWAMPEQNAERYAVLQMERRRAMVRMIEWVMTMVNASMVVVWMALPLAAFPGYEYLVGPAVVVTVLLSTLGALAPIGFYLPRLMRARDAIREIAGTEVLGTRDAGWKWGGLVYYAPEDPALIVPKRLGIGQTLNMARPAAWVFLVLVIVLPLAITFGAIALSS